MKLIEKIVSSPILVLIIMIKDLKDAIMEILSITSSAQSSFDYWDFFIKLAMAVAVWLVFRAFFKLRDELKEHEIKIKVYNIIMSYRNYRSFIQGYDGIEYFKSQEETDEQFIARLPEGQYIQQLINEQEIIKHQLIEKLDINRTTAEKYIKEAYSIFYKRNNDSNTNEK